ncbi:MAG TPA: tRNA (adenosine(37)-N6)-threonylcarbamoyltransferase complex dimerization subunit type 1 TsaB [Desulfuromonadaceae bacterium]|jgi:tRNA threonylcarbamoyladenosine biosynthesis protein TsaB
MNILTIDTSFSLASIAITAGEKVLAEALFNADRCLSARLIPEIERLFSITGHSCKEIDLFACSIGPGSFTGVRGGVATTQGLALAAEKPCIGFSTLALLAMNFPLAAQPVCTILDARKGEVYAALFGCSGGIPTALINDCVLAPEQLLATLLEKTDKGIIFTGDGAQRYREIIVDHLGERAIFAPFPYQCASASKGALLALDGYHRGLATDPSRLLPVYLRPSEAEYAKIERQQSLKQK